MIQISNILLRRFQTSTPLLLVQFTHMDGLSFALYTVFFVFISLNYTLFYLNDLRIEVVLWHEIGV